MKPYADRVRDEVERLRRKAAQVDASFDIAEALFRIQERRIAVIRERLKKHGILL